MTGVTTRAPRVARNLQGPAASRARVQNAACIALATPHLCVIVGGVLLTDTQTVVSWRARPRSFVALMGLYESNFIRFGWLAGSLGELAGQHRSCASGDCDLVLTVTERSPYTSTLNLTYLLPQQH